MPPGANQLADRLEIQPQEPKVKFETYLASLRHKSSKTTLETPVAMDPLDSSAAKAGGPPIEESKAGGATRTKQKAHTEKADQANFGQLLAPRWKDDFKVVGIHAEKEVRFQRIMKRNRSEDGDRNSFETRDEREKGWGLEQLITQADYILENKDPLSEFYKDTRDLLAKIKR